MASSNWLSDNPLTSTATSASRFNLFGLVPSSNDPVGKKSRIGIVDIDIALIDASDFSFKWSSDEEVSSVQENTLDDLIVSENQYSALLTALDSVSNDEDVQYAYNEQGVLEIITPDDGAYWGSLG